MAECIVDRTRRALREAWLAAENGPRATRVVLARVTRMVTEIAEGQALLGHLDVLRALAVELAALSPEAGRLLSDALDQGGDTWRAHVERQLCEAGICFARPAAPCHAACPAHIDIPGFIALIGHGRYSDALRVITADSPLGHSCGMICPAPCEDACVRGALGTPLFIRPMKAVAARRALAGGASFPLPKRAPPTGKRVAVIGSGPAGITAAWYLAVAGHQVKVFEAAPELGGMMRYGIPAYRLPPAVLDLELDNLKALGVMMYTSQPVRSIVALKAQGFDAIFAAPGLQLCQHIVIEGAHHRYVQGGVNFLRSVANGEDPRVGPKVVVIGGGNVAIDVSLTALRQGASQVTIVYRRTRGEMPAHRTEIAVALKEGVEIVNSWAPLRIKANNEVVFQRTSRVIDEHGRSKFTLDPADTLTLTTDHLLMAVGQAADLDLLEESAIEVEGGLITVDPVTLATGEPGVFAGGDITHGARTVVEAVRAGKQGAASIDAFLKGEPIDASWGVPQRRDDVSPLLTSAGRRSNRQRPSMPEHDVAERVADYRQIELGLTDAMADDEASRCLRCDLCIGCGLCELVCSEIGAEALRMVQTNAGRLAFDDFTRPAEHCLGCGACAEVCPTGAIHIEDDGNSRATVITGTVVRRQALHTCPACGCLYASEHMLAHLRDGLVPTVGALCPSCVRTQHSQAMATAFIATGHR